MGIEEYCADCMYRKEHMDRLKKILDETEQAAKNWSGNPVVKEYFWETMEIPGEPCKKLRINLDDFESVEITSGGKTMSLEDYICKVVTERIYAVDVIERHSDHSRTARLLSLEERGSL